MAVRVALTFAPFWMRSLAMESQPRERAIMSAEPLVEEWILTFAPLSRRIRARDSRPWETASWRMVRRMVEVTLYSVSSGVPVRARSDIMESDLSLRAARRGRVVGERWSDLRVTFWLRRKRTPSSLLADIAFKSTLFLSRTASTLAPLSSKASIKGVEGKRALLHRA